MSDSLRGRFAGKNVFVAGASGGINFAIAERFAQAAARVVLISRSEPRITQAASQLVENGYQALGMAADVRNYAAVSAALAQARAAFGEIDVLICGAAGNFVCPALGMSSNGFRTVVEIDLIGTFNVLRAGFEHLRRPGASIISISAPQGERPQMMQAHVCAAKAGVNMLTKCLAMEWGPAGVRVNAISPGPIAGTEGMARLAPTPDAQSAIKARVALREYGAKSDIADAAVFLASDEARYITGHILDCDGGTALGDASGDALSASARAVVGNST